MNNQNIRLLLLGSTLIPNYGELPYRGVHRARPYYCSEYPADHQVNRDFLWLCKEGGESGVVHDLSRAKELVKAYQSIMPPQFFDIIEVVSLNSNSVLNGDFLGWDIVCGEVGYSLLALGLRNVKSSCPPDTATRDILFRVESLQNKYRKKLNKYELFDDSLEACQCLDEMSVLKKLDPNLWESDPIDRFKITGVNLVKFEI
jgi:hypothetical protein